MFQAPVPQTGATPQSTHQQLQLIDTDIQGPLTELERYAYTTIDLYLGVTNTVEQIRDAWNLMKTEQGFLQEHVSQSIDIGVESLLTEGDRHKRNEVLHSSPEIVAKYTRITLLEIWYDYCRWSSIHSSLQELKALVCGGSPKEIRYHHVNILLALRDCLLRAAHTAYLSLGQLPEFKPYADFWFPNLQSAPASGKPWFIRYELHRCPEIKSSSILNSNISKVLERPMSLNREGNVGDPSLLKDLRPLLESLPSVTPEELQLLGAAPLVSLNDYYNIHTLFTTYTDFAKRYDKNFGGLGQKTWESVDRERKKERGRVRDIIFSTAIEKKIKHLQCLESPSTLKEIWEALEQTCVTKEQMCLDNMLGFREHLPLLKIPNLEEVPEEPVPVITEPLSTQLVTSIAVDDIGSSTTDSIEEKVALQLNSVHICRENEPKKEETGPQSARQRSDGRPEQSQYNVPSKGHQPFPLGRRRYETMEKLLVTGTGMPWSDFDKVMATLGFSHTSKGGSAVSYKAPEWSSLKPFRVHRTSRTRLTATGRRHSSHTSQMEPWLVLGVRKNITKNLDWKLEHFSDERCSGQDPRNHPHLYGSPEAPSPSTTAKKINAPNNLGTRRFKDGKRRNSEVSKN